MVKDTTSLPYTRASARIIFNYNCKLQWSFSKLRLIKSYLRSTMGQDRLRALALLSIEADSAKLMKTEKLIDCFATAKARRKTFFWIQLKWTGIEQPAARLPAWALTAELAAEAL